MLSFLGSSLRALHLDIIILSVVSCYTSVANPIDQGKQDFVKTAARNGFQNSGTLRANSSVSGRNYSVNLNSEGDTQRDFFGRRMDSGGATGLDSVNFAFSLGRDIRTILEKLDKVASSSLSGYLALTARVASLENSVKADFTNNSANISEGLQNLRLALTNRLALLENGVAITARTSMKCSLKKRSKPVPAGTMKAGDELYTEEQFCATDLQTCLYLQSNGNMVLHRTMTLQVIWTSYTGVGDCRSLLKMQDDGRLAVYHFPTTVARWATPLAAGAELGFRANGHLCLRSPGAADNSDCLWSTDFIDPAWESQIYYQK